MREFTRYSTDIPVNLQIHSVESTVIESKLINGCQMSSISQGGLCCEIDSKVALGSKVVISIPSVIPEYFGHGEISWCQQKDAGPQSKQSVYEIGVRFVDGDEATISRMVQQVCQIEHYKNIVFDREGKLLDGKQAAEQWITKHQTGEFKTI